MIWRLLFFLSITAYILLCRPLKVLAAANYFDFNFISDPPVLNSKGEIGVNIIINGTLTEGEKFTVRPVVNEGAIFIWTKKQNSWIKDSDVWSELPALEEEMAVKIFGFTSGSILVSFQIQGQKSFQIYETNKKRAFGYKYSADYISKLNEKMGSVLAADENSQITSSESSESETKPLIFKELNKGWMAPCLVVWVLFAFLGFLYHRIHGP